MQNCCAYNSRPDHVTALCRRCSSKNKPALLISDTQQHLATHAIQECCRR
jgi:hypothetical protein